MAPLTSPTSPPLQDGDLLAAIDLGSNSFHMVVARSMLGQLRVGRPPARDRAHGRRPGRQGRPVRRGPPARTRTACPASASASATSPPPACAPWPPIRCASCASRRIPGRGRSRAGQTHRSGSGREEARLIYLGVAHAQPPKAGQRRLVIDIGGGSTEFIIGRGFETLERESLQAGCIASTRRFFPGGKLCASAGRKRSPRSAPSSSSSPACTAACGVAGSHRLVRHRQGHRRDLRRR